MNQTDPCFFCFEKHIKHKKILNSKNKSNFHKTTLVFSVFLKIILNNSFQKQKPTKSLNSGSIKDHKKVNGETILNFPCLLSLVVKKAIVKLG